VVCATYFLETHGTLFHGKPHPAERLVQVVTALAEGLGIRAVARVFAVDPNTVLAWLSEVGAQLVTFSRSLLHDVHVTQVQFDEVFAVLGEHKVGQVRETEAIEPLPRSAGKNKSGHCQLNGLQPDSTSICCEHGFFCIPYLVLIHI
jgi:hypothetical protein